MSRPSGSTSARGYCWSRPSLTAAFVATELDVARVRFVKSAQRLGFSLDEISELLQLEDGTHCHEAAELAVLRLADVRSRLTDLRRMESALSKLVKECSTQHGNVVCPLIAALR